jgi:hypothetical protein
MGRVLPNDGSGRMSERSALIAVARGVGDIVWTDVVKSGHV